MNAALLAEMLLQLMQVAQGIAQTQQTAAAENRDVSDAEIAAHRQQVTDMRAKLLADLQAGN
jgi:hypothetical protein